MTIILIAAVARNGIIGRDGTMPWKVPGEQKFFKDTTMGHPMIMGRTTFESMGVLPGRRSIVLTRDPSFTAEGVEVAHSLDEALFLTQDDDVFVVGGAQIYQLTMPIADRMILSRVPFDADGDTSFPGWPLEHSDAWTLASTDPHDGWDVLTFVRTKPRTQVEFGERITRGGNQKTGVSCAIRDGERLLLTRRQDNGLWCLPGGGVDSGESWSEAAIREVYEETGLSVRVASVLGVYTDPDAAVVYPDGRRTQIFGVCFRGTVVDGSAGLSDEVTQVGWFTAGEAARLPIIPLHRPLVRTAFEPAETAATFV